MARFECVQCLSKKDYDNPCVLTFNDECYDTPTICPLGCGECQWVEIVKDLETVVTRGKNKE